jgi:hypothetical protein
VDEATQGEKNERVAGAPGPIQIGGVTYLASPPSDVEFGALHKYLREKLADPIQSVAKSIGGLPLHLQKMAVTAAVEIHAGGGAKLTDEFVGQQVMQPDGCAYLAWLLIRKQHPEVTLETIRNAIPDTEAAMRVLGDLYDAAGLRALSGKAAGRPV